MKVIVIDDRLSIEDLKDIRCHLFPDPEVGMTYVLNHLDERMVVFTNVVFENSSRKVTDILDTIRKRTSLVHVVVFADRLRYFLDNGEITRLLNDPNLSCITDWNDMQEAVDRIETEERKRFDCVLEEWLLRHPEDESKTVMRVNGHDYTWSSILHEVRMRTECGMDFERRAMMSAIKRLKDSA